MSKILLFTRKENSMTETQKSAELGIQIGAGLIESGGEVARAEESALRISRAMGMKRCDVFAIISYISVSVENYNGEVCTRSRRIRSGRTDFSKLERINDVSRKICREKLDYETAISEFNIAKRNTEVSLLREHVEAMLVGASFALYFGGGIREALVSALCANIIQFMKKNIKSQFGNPLVFTCITSFMSGIAGYWAVRFGLAGDYNYIAIGNIMLLVPGLSLIGAARDIITGDLLCGILRFVETLLIALAIAIGFSLPVLIF